MVRSVSEKLSLEELRHILTTMNSWNADEVDCPICASARVKLEALIKKEREKPVKETKEIAGISCVIEHTKE